VKAKPTSSPTFVKTSALSTNPWKGKERNKPRLRSSATSRKRIAELEARRVPVLMRGTISGLPMATPRRPVKTGRRVDVPLGIPGAEIRLPSIPQIQAGWRLVSAILSLALVALLYLLWTAPVFRIDSVNIQGLQRISAKEVLIELNLEDHPIFSVDPQTLREQIITQFPEFRSVEVSLRLPNKVTIQVEERKPIFVWKQDERTLLVDAEGVAFPLRSENASLPKLVVEASTFPQPIQPELQNELREPLLPIDLVSGILSISAQIPDGAVLFYDGERGLGWRDPRGWTVYVGESKDLGLKMKIYELMVKKIIKKEEQKPVLISIEYVHAPYYRLER
jgi:cell division protein FtsQ